MLLPIEWLPEGRVRYLDQTRLPAEEMWLETADYRDIAAAIRRLSIRGAPLIGVAAGYALALAALSIQNSDLQTTLAFIRQASDDLAATRPTAVNLRWALSRSLAGAERADGAGELRRSLIEEALLIHREDIEANQRIGDLGAKLLPEPATILTHCNAGSLATGGYGTALGVIRSAWAQGKLRHVYACETRPLLQGARLTSWELQREEIPFTLLVDSAAGQLLARREVDAVIVGADRIAANGDTANKIGTYSLAVLARENGVPFYVAAPASTVDLSIPDGSAIPIEQRSPEEVTSVGSQQVAPTGVKAANPAFDVTPNRYITAIISEHGVAAPVFDQSLRQLISKGLGARG